MIWIMRHATAGPTTDAKNDDKRPLDAGGRREAQAAGIALRKLRTPIQHCFASPLRRAEETAELVCKELGLDVHVELKLAGQPLTVDETKTMVSGHGNCLLVGHAPSVNLMVFRFTGAQVQLTKGGLAQIHEGELWSVLNASTCLVMADEELGAPPFKDPQEVDHRSFDDQLWREIPKQTAWMLH